VRVNSIVAVKGEGPDQDGDDGVVRYRSAHLEGVESELVVQSAHSVQGSPEAIEEIRRRFGIAPKSNFSGRHRRC
jgi:hypothetical protein